MENKCAKCGKQLIEGEPYAMIGKGDFCEDCWSDVISSYDEDGNPTWKIRDK